MALSFDVAHIRTDDADDTLKVFVSADCGATWSQVFSKNSHEIAFTSVGQFEFIGWLPDTTGGDWKSQYIDLSSYAGKEKMQIQFRLIHEESNNIYIRNIFFGPHTGISDHSTKAFRIYPNPAVNGICSIDPAGFSGSGCIEILNMLGAVVQTKDIPANVVPVILDLTSLTAGIYIVKIVSGCQQWSQKLVIQN